MEKITLSVRRDPRERHGLLLLTYDLECRVVWFKPDDAVRKEDGRLEWNLQGYESEIVSRDLVRELGVNEIESIEKRIKR